MSRKKYVFYLYLSINHDQHSDSRCLSYYSYTIPHPPLKALLCPPSSTSITLISRRTPFSSLTNHLATNTVCNARKTNVPPPSQRWDLRRCPVSPLPAPLTLRTSTKRTLRTLMEKDPPPHKPESSFQESPYGALLESDPPILEQKMNSNRYSTLPSDRFQDPHKAHKKIHYSSRKEGNPNMKPVKSSHNNFCDLRLLAELHTLEPRKSYGTTSLPTPALIPVTHKYHKTPQDPPN